MMKFGVYSAKFREQEDKGSIVWVVRRDEIRLNRISAKSEIEGVNMLYVHGQTYLRLRPESSPTPPRFHIYASSPEETTSYYAIFVL